VQRQLQRVDGVGLVFADPKTQFGNRVVAMGPVTIDKMREHRMRQAEERNIAGSQWVEMDLIFPSAKGTPRDGCNLMKEFRELLQQAGLPHMRFHDLRHTSVTLVLNEIGAPVKEAQHRAGHASPSTTINIYAGMATTKTDEMVARKLDELITPVKIELHTFAHDAKGLPDERHLDQHIWGSESPNHRI
jgi:integrase